MATKVILPKLGQTMEEGTIVEWVKQEGDAVSRGDVLFQVESDKAVLEVEARSRGVLRKILLEPGVKVPVMTVVGIIGSADEDISALLTKAGGGEVEPAPSTAPAETAAPAPDATPTAPVAAAPVREGGRIFSSPRARKTAAKLSVDIALVTGTGPNGRIVEKDVLAYAEAQPAATPLARRVAQEAGVSLADVTASGSRIGARDVVAASAPAPAPAAQAAPAQVTPMSGVRAIIADRMGTSAHTTAPVTLQSVADATAFVALRTQLKDALANELGFNVGYNDLLAVMVAKALRQFPYMNVRLTNEGIVQLPEVNLGMAVDSERGLLVPVIRNADAMGIKELALAFRELVARAREGKSLPDDLTGGTFTITNLGMFGVDMFTPIINLPECAILGVGRIRPEAAVVDGEIIARSVMWLSLTFDHRLVDGAPAARFLQAIVQYIESPYLLLA